MYSLRKLVWVAYLVVGILLAIIIALGINQYALSSRYSSLIEQSEKAIFQFATLREAMTESLLERNWSKLERVIPDIENFNSELARLQENSLIPAQYKMALVDKVDLTGLILSVRRLAGGASYQEEGKKIQQEMRTLAEHLLQFDRIIVSEARARILNYQMIVIGVMGIIISLAAFSLNKLYQNTVVPLLRMSSHLKAGKQLPEGLGGGVGLSREVADLVEEIKLLSAKGEQIIEGESKAGRDLHNSKVAEVINETTNSLNGIINYAQLLVDDDKRSFSQEEREILEKIIESGLKIARSWQRIT